MYPNGGARPAARGEREMPPDIERRRNPIHALAHVAAVVAFYAAMAVVVLSPGLSDMWQSNALPETKSAAHEADINLINWVLAWDWHALTTAPASLFQANIFHPAPNALASSEHLLGHLPVFGPAFAITGNAVFASQFNLLICFALSGAAVYALLRHWGTGAAAAIFAGMVYSFASARLLLVAHSHLLAGYHLPLALIAFDRCLRRPGWGSAAAFASLFLLQILASYYLAYMAALAMLGYGAGVVWARRGRVPLRAIVLLGTTSAVALAIFVAISLPYLQLARSGAIPDYDDRALLAASTGQWRSYLERAFPSPRGGPYVPPRLYLGWSVLLAAAAAFGWRRGASPLVPWAAAGALGLAFVCYLMGIGPTTEVMGTRVNMPYSWLRDVVPGFSSMRVPRRFSVFVALGVACLAGLGAERLLARRARGWILVAILMVVAAWDLGLARRKFDALQQPVGAMLPPIYKHVAVLPPAPLLELPIRGAGAYFFTGAIVESRRMLASTHHWLPLLNGQSGYPPASYWTVVSMAQALPDLAALELLTRATGLRYVLVHTKELSPLDIERWEDPPGLRELHRAGGDRLFAIVDPPPADLTERLLATGEQTHTLLGTPIEPLPEAGRRAAVTVTHSFSEETFVNHIVVVRGTVTNASQLRWPSVSTSTSNLVVVRCRWRIAPGYPVTTRVPFEASLPLDLAPGESLDFAFQCTAPTDEAKYLLQIGVAQGDRWFEGGSEPVRVKVSRPPRRRR